MSAQPKYKEENYYSEKTDLCEKVNLRDLVDRMKKEGKKEKKIILSFQQRQYLR